MTLEELFDLEVDLIRAYNYMTPERTKWDWETVLISAAIRAIDIDMAYQQTISTSYPIISPADFERLYNGTYVPDERQMALEKQLADYYRVTENMKNPYHRTHWDLFKRWCDDRCYTQQEIIQAKRNVSRDAN